MPTFVLLVVLALTAVGCGGDRETTLTRDGRTVFLMTVLDCDDEASCMAGWTIGGRFYEARCRSDLPVTGKSLYAVAGENVPDNDEAWTVARHDPVELVLIPQIRGCPSGHAMYGFSA